MKYCSWPNEDSILLLPFSEATMVDLRFFLHSYVVNYCPFHKFVPILKRYSANIRWVPLKLKHNKFCSMWQLYEIFFSLKQHRSMKIFRNDSTKTYTQMKLEIRQMQRLKQPTIARNWDRKHFISQFIHFPCNM